jgi:hypothetical protein
MFLAQHATGCAFNEQSLSHNFRESLLFISKFLLCQIVYFRYFGVAILFNSLRQPANADVTNAWSPCSKPPEYLMHAAHLNKCTHLILLSVDCE